MVNPDLGANVASTESLLKELVRLHFSLGLCLMQLDRIDQIKLENTNSSPRKYGGFSKIASDNKIDLSRDLIAALSNDTRETLSNTFGDDLQDVIDIVKHNPWAMLDSLKSPDNVLIKIIGNTHLLAETENKADNNIEVEELLKESGTNQNFEDRNEIETENDGYIEPEVRTNYSGLEIIQIHL